MAHVDERQLVNLLIRWNKSQLRGKPVGPDELCPDNAALREALRERIDQLLAIEGTIESLNADDRRQNAPGSGGDRGDSGRLLTHSVDSKRLSNIVPRGLRSFDRRDAHFFQTLLPGPCNTDGLPQCIGFWKSRIEAPDRNQAFTVGVMYGPSGAGKSSLVKAGLIPSLSDRVVSVYVEAGSDGAEQRLIDVLQRRCAGVDGDEVPTSATESRQTLIVLDQFERWLLANKNPDAWPTSALVETLRQCDGNSVQCLLVVRDDFWMLTGKFLRQLGTSLVDGENSNAIESFSGDLAHRVLAAFGRAFGALPHDERTPDSEQSRFLELSISGLVEDGRVTPVRLSLFAEAMKGRPWNCTTLALIVGAEEIGISFLEASLGSPHAPPDNRKHLKAACAVLHRMLQGANADTVGPPLSYTELLDASGYRDGLQDFEELLRVLDNELRLITPSDAASIDEAYRSRAPGGSKIDEGHEVIVDRATLPVDASLHSYQLTHDVLVPLLREWLVQKRSETVRGRARLTLEERVSRWTARSDSRLLPTLPEFVAVQLWTDRRQWTVAQRQMMTRAALWHGTRWLRIGTIVLMIGFSIHYASNIYSTGRMQNAISSVLNNPPDALFHTFEDLKRLPREAALKEFGALRNVTNGVDRLRIEFAMAELGVVDTAFLCSQIETAPVEEADNLIDALGRARDASLKGVRTAADRHRAARSWLQEGRLALVALYLKEPRIASDMCRIDGHRDPVWRACFIEAMTLWPGNVARLAEFARTTDDRALRSAICLGLSEIDQKHLTSDIRSKWLPLLAEWVKSAPDGLTRAAAELTIYHWDLEVPTFDKAPEAADWQVNTIGMILNRIPADSVATTAETADSVKRPVTFMISDREILVRQYQMFLSDTSCPDSEKPVPHPAVDQTEPSFPAHAVNWSDAVLFCNWLSRKENLTPYYVQAESVDASGVHEWRRVPDATGYRLPTEEQWEFACRAGTVTEFACGDGFLLTRFANVVGAGLNPCGMRFPNGWGLFDMHGNVSEWCDRPFADPVNATEAVTGEFIRGGSWMTPVSNSASAYRSHSDASERMDDVGFRIVLPDSK